MLTPEKTPELYRKDWQDMEKLRTRYEHRNTSDYLAAVQVGKPNARPGLFEETMGLESCQREAVDCSRNWEQDEVLRHRSGPVHSRFADSQEDAGLSWMTLVYSIPLVEDQVFEQEEAQHQALVDCLIDTYIRECEKEVRETATRMESLAVELRQMIYNMALRSMNHDDRLKVACIQIETSRVGLCGRGPPRPLSVQIFGTTIDLNGTPLSSGALRWHSSDRELLGDGRYEEFMEAWGGNSKFEVPASSLPIVLEGSPSSGLTAGLRRLTITVTLEELGNSRLEKARKLAEHAAVATKVVPNATVLLRVHYRSAYDFGRKRSRDPKLVSPNSQESLATIMKAFPNGLIESRVHQPRQTLVHLIHAPYSVARCMSAPLSIKHLRCMPITDWVSLFSEAVPQLSFTTDHEECQHPECPLCSDLCDQEITEILASDLHNDDE
jgi:hypothetical protein